MKVINDLCLSCTEFCCFSYEGKDHKNQNPFCNLRVLKFSLNVIEDNIQAVNMKHFPTKKITMDSKIRSWFVKPT